MENLLEVSNLNVSFNTYAGEVKAVRGIDFNLGTKETLAFVGESGCGKTVTAKSILRLLKPPFATIKEGSSIIYKGRNVLDMNKSDLSHYRGKEVSMIFQDPMTSLNPTMTVGNQIMESLLIHRYNKNIDNANTNHKEEARKEAIRFLEMVNIADASKRMNEYPHQLSGGMRQRIMIAIALSCYPSILIADEPTTALDVTIQAQILDLLKNLKEDLGTSIILVTHDLGVVANFADRIQVMYAGQVVERGLTSDIFYNPKHPYTWALLRSVPAIDSVEKEVLYSLKGTPPDLLLPLQGCGFANRCDYCMKICKEEKPKEININDNHSVSCWLNHPMAPSVEPPIKAKGNGGI